MIEKILPYEQDLFFMLNGSNSCMLDYFMWFYSGKAPWIPAAIFILVILIYKKGWRDSLIILISIVLVITLCDQLASGVLKPFFGRLRPTHHPLFMDKVDTVLGYRGGRYGFISSHAANAFGFATYMALLLRYSLFSWVIYSWATVTAYSRIYLGVHFISDIVPGIIVGLVFGYLVYRMYKLARKLIVEKVHASDGTGVLYTTLQKRMIVCGILVTVLLLYLLGPTLKAIFY